MSSTSSDALLADRYAAVSGPVPRKLDDVPGWLTLADKMLFAWLLDRQSRTQIPGDLLEIGVYQGKSAIHMGQFRRPGEQMTVCDLFDCAGDELSIHPGARQAYSTLTQDTFERNYLAFHDELPAIVRGLSETIVDHVAALSCRFVHIDGSHMYEHVRADMLSARSLLRPDGIVAFDDYRTEHCPGTAAAVWEAVATEGLKVICLSANKLYGTWGDARAVQDELIEYVATLSDHRCDIQQAMGQRLVRLAKVAPKAAAKPKAKPVDPEALLAQSREVLATAQSLLSAASGARTVPVQRETTTTGWRSAVVAALPPAVTAAIRRRRRAH